MAHRQLKAARGRPADRPTLDAKSNGTGHIRIAISAERRKIIVQYRDAIACPFMIHCRLTRTRHADLEAKAYPLRVGPERLTREFKRLRRCQPFCWPRYRRKYCCDSAWATAACSRDFSAPCPTLTWGRRCWQCITNHNTLDRWRHWPHAAICRERRLHDGLSRRSVSRRRTT